MVKSRLGSEDLEACLTELGSSLAGEFASRVAGLEGERLLKEICQIMLELGYESEAVPSTDGPGLEIRAHNCVFHDLAQEHNEVCALDIALIERLAGGPVDHAECMVRGGTCCRFRRKKG